MNAHIVLYVLGGATAGFVYQRVVGCRSGACVITSNRYVATMYGALIGYVAAGGAH